MNSTAIINSRSSGWDLGRLAAIFAVLTVLAGTVSAQTNGPASFLAYAQQTLVSARERHHREPTNSEATWQLGRALFDRGEFANNDTERATLAVEGIDVMRRMVAREPKSAAAHFFLAMNLGQFARTKLLGALKIVEEMETEFEAARDLDEHFEYAGADRNLGLLYFQAPGWPASIGNRSKARKHLERAVALAPEFPENQLNLLEAYIEWDDQKDVKRELQAIADLWPEAKKRFTGEIWASSWADWEKRRGELQSKAGPKPGR